MKYVSFDIETTGTNPAVNQMIQLAMIIEDTNNILPYEKMPKLNAIITHSKYVFNKDLVAFNINKDLMTRIYKEEKLEGEIWVHSPSILSDTIRKFFSDNLLNQRVTIAGKNVATFDKPFLLSYLTDMFLPSPYHFSNRAIDPSVLYADWKNDIELPSSQTVYDRAGISATLSHNALDDAWQIIRTLRKSYE